MLAAHSLLRYAIAHTVYTETKREKAHTGFTFKSSCIILLFYSQKKKKKKKKEKGNNRWGDLQGFFPFSQTVQRRACLTSMVISNCPVLQISKAGLLLLENKTFFQLP